MMLRPVLFGWAALETYLAFFVGQRSGASEPPGCSALVLISALSSHAKSCPFWCSECDYGLWGERHDCIYVACVHICIHTQMYVYMCL